MPPRKFDKKTSTTYALVHRAQNDPLINDEDAPSMVLAEKAQPRRPTEEDYAYSSAGSIISSSSAYRSSRTRRRGDLEDEFAGIVRSNEGEAAEQGVFFDDSGYDYMQHMRDLGSGEGTATWIDASSQSATQKGKGKERLEDALRSLSVDDERSVGTMDSTASSRSLFPESMFSSEFVRKRTYQDQQDVPDEIAGLQPDMDPSLREVLEALDDEEYVEDEDEDFFAELTRDGYEVDKDEWERTADHRMLDDDEEGWESDDTVRARSPVPMLNPPLAAEAGVEGVGEVDAMPPEDTQAQPPADPTDGAWLDEFKKFKSANKSSTTAPPPGPSGLLGDKATAPAPSSLLESSALSSLATGRKKKRKGAKTSTTNYSMTSSALARTDQQSLLDDRFDKLEAAYEADEYPDDEEDEADDSVSAVSGLTGASRVSRVSRYSTSSALSKASGASNMSSYSRATDSGAPVSQRKDFDTIMDDFLGAYSTTGKAGRRVRRGGRQSGMEQLDEIRGGLGPARVKAKSAAAL